ncbi:hypothetical protein FNL10_01850 [Staphylococcus hominis]|nr:hypothetical protein FNL10_01850 [Staphylococcus hominis]
MIVKIDWYITSQQLKAKKYLIKSMKISRNNDFQNIISNYLTK